MKVHLMAGLMIGLLSTSPAWAQSLTIINPGFEDDVIPAGAFTVQVPTGWSIYDPSGIINQTDNAVGLIRPLPGVEFFPGGTPEGNQAALVYLAGAQNGAAGLQQTLADTLQPWTTYVLTVQIGNIASGTSLPGSSDGGGQFYNLDGFPGYRVELLAGGIVLAADDNSLDGFIPEGEWRLSTVAFTTGESHPQLGQFLGIRLINLDHAGTPEIPNIEVDFDQVALVASAVPEPATWTLCLLGAGGLGLRRWRRRRSASTAFHAV